MGSGTPFVPGIVLYGSYPEVLSDKDELIHRLRMVAGDAFFDVVEIPFVDDEALWSKLGDIVAQAGMKVVTSAGPACVKLGWSLASLDPARRRVAIEGMRRAVEFSYAVGSRALVFMSGSDPGPDRRAESREVLIDSVGAIADYARTQASDYFLGLLLEPADRGLAHNQLIGPSREAASLVARIREQSIQAGIALDMSHIAQLGESMEEATSRLGGLVLHAHLANAIVRDPSNPGFGDQHPRFGLPAGEFGVRDASRFLELVTTRCFARAVAFPYGKPVVSLEVKPAAGEDADLVLAGAKRVLIEACRRLDGPG